MPITPEQCLKLTDADESFLSDLEKKIDVQLQEQFHNLEVVVAVALTQRLNEKIFGYLKNRYFMAGWDVVQKSGSDDVNSISQLAAMEMLAQFVGRKGHWLEFKARTDCGDMRNR